MSERGLYGKYRIEKSDGSPVDPEAVYFTLRLDTDPHAREAIRAYIASCRGEQPELAADLERVLARICRRVHGVADAEKLVRKLTTNNTNKHG